MKIVSLLPSATEILCALDLRDELVAVTHECDFPPEVQSLPRITSSRISHESLSSREIDHAVRSQIDGHGSIYDLDTGLLEMLRPDLIVTQELCDVCAVNYQMVSRAARVFSADSRIVSLEPNTIEDVFSTISTLGELTHRRETATKVVNHLQGRLDRLKAKSATITAKPRVMMLEWLEPPFAPGHWVPQQVHAAGGICLLGNAGQPSRTTSYDQILSENPDVLVLIPCGYYISDTIRQIKSVRFPSSWRSMAAINSGQIWALDATSYFSRPGPRLIDGAEILAKLLHPQLFGEPSPSEALKIDANLIQFDG
jgi:iron complex transport system substrate-binding protein